MWLGVTPCVHGLERYTHPQPLIGALQDDFDPLCESEKCANRRMLPSRSCLQVFRCPSTKVDPGSLLRHLRREFQGRTDEIPSCAACLWTLDRLPAIRHSPNMPVVLVLLRSRVLMPSNLHFVLELRSHKK